MFGAAAKPAAAGLFGAAPSGGGLFGAAPAFGTPSAGAFGAAPATPSFGAPAAGGGLFGAASAAPAFGAAAPATPFGGATYPGAATPFGAAPAATPAFGAFGAPAAAPSAPAFGSAFGAPAAAASTPFGSAFGAAAPAAGAFPFGSAAAKPAAPAFGAGAFGAPAAASTGLFGAPAAAAPSAFGAPAAGAFGAPAASTGLFGAPAAATPAFGAAAPAFGGSAFGAAATSTAFGAAAPGAGSIFGGAAAGGGLKFQPTTESETNGQQTTQVKFFSITAMPQASGLSFEEIRLNDYMAGRRGGPAPAAAATGSIFGAPAPAAASPFGAPAASPFGAPAAAPAFGAPAASTGLFGAPAPTAAPAFGAPAGGLFGAPAAAPAPNIFGAPAAAPAFGAPAAGGLFGAPTTAQTSASLFGASAPAFGAPAASTPGFGAGGLSGGLGAFSSLSTPAPAANPSLSFPGLGAPAAGGSIFAGLGAPAASPFGAPTSSSLFPTTAPSLSAYPSAGSGASLFPAFGAPAAGTSAASMYGVAQPTLEVRLNTPGAFGALPAVASSLTVPPAPAAQAVALPAAPASVGKKPALAPLLRMTPSSAAKLKPRAAGRSFVYDSLADPAAAPVPEAFAPRSDLRRLILEPEDAPTPARAATAPASVLAAVALSSPASATSPVSPAPAPATQNGAAPASNGGVGASGVVRPKASKPPRGSLSVLSPSHESPLASPAREEAGEAAPQLTRADYYTEPPIEALHAMHDDELRRVRNFAVGRTGVGRVAFDGDTDVRGLNLDELVHFNAAPREIEVYPEGTAKPDVGRGLNKPATVTLEACFPAARPGASSTDPERLALYEERLRKFTANIDGASFVAYDRSTGRWTFRVRHFSKYGLAGLDDDDDDGPDAAAKPPAKRPAGPPAPAAAAKASAKPAAPIAAPAALRALPLRSPAASALSIEEPEGDEEEEVLRGRGAPRLSLSVHEADEQDDEGMAGRDEADDELEPLEAYGAAAVEEPEEADFAEADEPADEDEPRPARRPAVAPLRREQMREHLFPQSDEAMPPAHDQRDQDDEARDDEEEEGDGAASMMEPPTMSLLPTSLFPPRAPERPLASLPVLPAPAGPVRVREREKAPITLPARAQPDVLEGRRPLARSFRAAWGPRGMLVVPRVGSALAKVQLAQVSAGGLLVPPPPARPLRSLPFAAPPLQTPAPAAVPADVVAKYVPLLELHRAASAPTNAADAANGALPALALTAVERFLDRAEAALAPSPAADEHYALLLWRLVRALFVPLPPDAPHATHLARRRLLGKWIADAARERIEAALRAAQSNDPCEAVFADLTGRRLEHAAAECVRAKDLRLATLVAQALSDEIRADADAQLKALEAFPMQPHRRRVYALLAGLLDRHDVLRGVDWLRAFALHLWYRAPTPTAPRPSTEPLPQVLAAYSALMTAGRATAPLPPYVADLPPAQAAEAARQRFLAEGLTPSGAAAVEALFRTRGAFDTAYLLLCRYCDPAFPLARVLSPLGHTPRVLDARLSWQLLTVLQALGHAPVPVAPDAAYARLHQVARVRSLHWVHALALSFAAQLETAGLWHWAVYALLHLPATEYSLPLKVAAVRHTLARNALVGARPGVLRAEERFVLELGVPAPWLHEARAWAARAALDPRAEFEELVAAQRPADAHAVLAAHVAPAVLLDLSGAAMTKDELHRALAALRDAFAATGAWPREWRTGGGLYLSYLRARQEHDELRAALRDGALDDDALAARRGNLQRSVLAALRVLHGLNAAVAPAGQASTREQGVAWIEMATFLAELLVRLLDSAEQRRRVLRDELTSLPLTENHRHNLLHLCMGSHVGVVN